MDATKSHTKQSYIQVLTIRFAALDEPKKHKIIGSIYLIMTLFTVAIFGIFAIQPTLSTISNLQRQYEDNKQVEAELITKRDALRQLRQQYSDLSPSPLDLAIKAIPQRPELALFTRQLEKIAQASNMSIQRINIGVIELYPNAAPATQIRSFSFDLAVTGTDDDANTFINAVSSFDRIISIDSINKAVNEQGESADKSKMQVTMVGKVHFTK